VKKRSMAEAPALSFDVKGCSIHYARACVRIVRAYMY